MREPGFDKKGAHDAIFASEFLKTAIRPMNFAHDVHLADHDMRQRQLPELFFEPRWKRRAKTQACPARRPISLASAHLVRVAGTPVELVECHNFYSR
jgi:hypothetical protein